MIPKSSPWRSKRYLQWLRTQRCVISRREDGIQAAHVNLPGSSGMSQKAPDYMCLPVHWRVHRAWHDGGHPSMDKLIDLLKRVLQSAMIHGVLSGRLEMEFDSVAELVVEWQRAFNEGECHE